MEAITTSFILRFVIKRSMDVTVLNIGLYSIREKLRKICVEYMKNQKMNAQAFIV